METKREKAIKSKKGIILYSKGTDKWWLQYPDGSKRWGGATTIRVMNFIYYISKGKSIDEADRLAFKVVKRKR